MGIRYWLFIFYGCSILHIHAQVDSMAVKAVRQHIAKHWAGTVITLKTDSAEYIGLPKPYSVPSVLGEKHFREMYYWDTYFTNLGLLRDGQVEQAVNNVDNILFVVAKFGHMLNGSHTRYLNRSQPPFLSMMVADVFDVTHDTAWLKRSVGLVQKEYLFWTGERKAFAGLSHYAHTATDPELVWMAKTVAPGRLRMPELTDSMNHSEIIKCGSHYTAECESGWDFTPRFGGKCLNYIPIDLNCNLYMYEKNFARFYGILGDHESSKQWENIAKKRKKLIDKYCRSKKTGMYCDYNYVTHKKSDMVTAASFYPYYVGMAKGNRGLKKTLHQLEASAGIRACVAGNYALNYQWGDQNCWAPLQFIAFKALENYHYNNEAERIKNKFVDVVVKNFNETHNLWEKYNVNDGSIQVINEYAMPAFLGWTAGVFVYFTEK